MTRHNSEHKNESLQELIAEFLDAENRGEPLDRGAFVDRNPAYAESLRAFFARHDQMASATDFDTPTLAPDTVACDDATLLPRDSADDEEEKTLVGNESSAGSGPAVGDSVRYFGDYELLEEIARGGMGVVFKALQTNLNRIVALKMILAGQFAGEEDVQRFYTEAEAAAQLDHPGIVPIFEIGEHAGQHYFSMGYIEGESLAPRVAEGPLPPREAAELVARICEAMAYAHRRGVIHRDLKPANILIDPSGQPKVTDFGLAKRTEADSGLTGTGQILGTPSFMPPEQASGKVEDVGPLADVYALGAILYSTLTGRPPFQAASPMETLLQVLEKEPVAPRQLNPAIDEDLQTICLKCLEKDPPRRYVGAAELQDELNRYLAGEPIIARPIGRIERAWRWCKRKPTLASLIAVAASLMLVLSIGGPLVAIQQARFAKEQIRLKTQTLEARDEAEQRRNEMLTAQAEAEAAKKEVEREKLNDYANRISLAYREWSARNPKGTQKILGDCPAEMRNWEWDYLDGLTRAEDLAIFAHDYPVSVQFTPSGTSVVTRGNSDQRITVWDSETGLETNTESIPNLRSCSVGHDDDHVLIVSRGSISYASQSERKVETYGNLRILASAGLVYDNGNRIAAAFNDGTVTLYKRPSDEELFRTPKKMKSGKPHVFAPNARSVAGTEGMTVKVWDVKTGEERWSIEGHGMSVEAYDFSPDSSILASVGGDGSLILTEMTTGNRLHTIRAHAGGIKAVAFSPDGTRVATGSMDRTCRVFDVQTGSEVLAISGHTAPIVGVSFSPQGDRLATASADGTARIWDITHRLNIAPEVAQVLKEQKLANMGHVANFESRIYYGYTTQVYDVAISPDSRFVATAAVDMDGDGGDNLIKVWATEDSAIYATFPVPNGYLHTLSYSADSRYLIVASGGAGDQVSQASVAVWDLETKEKFKTFGGIACMLTRATLNPQNDLLAIAYGNQNYGQIRIYSWPDGELLHERNVAGQRLSSIAFSSEGDELLSSSHPGGKVEIWNARANELVDSFQAHGTGVFQIAVSRDDKVATANIDGTIGIWDWKQRKRLATLLGHSVYAVDIDFSPDGTRLVSSSEDETVKVWDLNSYSELLTFRDHRAPAMGTDWSDDGTTIASVSRDGSMVLHQVLKLDDQQSSWVTTFEDSFDRKEVGPNWDGSGWTIENGTVVGTLAPIPSNGGSFPGSFLSLAATDLPRTVEVSADIKLRNPMLTQFVFYNRRTQQYIAPLIELTTTPYGFIGSAVQVARGEGKNTKLMGGSNIELQPDTTYRMRVVRHFDTIKLFIDDRLLDHVRIPTMEAEMFQLSGCWGSVGDQIEFDNVVVRMPKNVAREMELRKRVDNWLNELIFPELVEEEIELKIVDENDRKLAHQFLDSLAAGKTISSDDVVKTFYSIAVRSDATDREYDVAARQARYYFERKPESWHMGKVGMALLRAGEPEQALDVCDRGIGEEIAKAGYGKAIPYACRALALIALGRDDEARLAHQRFLDLNLAWWADSDQLPLLADELKEKVPLSTNPLRETLIRKLVQRDKAYWHSRDIAKAYADVSAEFIATSGRFERPDAYDLELDRDQTIALDAIFSSSNPPLGLRLIWDQIEFINDENHATVQWVAISKIANNVFRYGQRYRFQQEDGQWKIVSLRHWRIDQLIDGKWTTCDEDYFRQQDQRIEQMKSAGDPGLARVLISAQRPDEALEVARKIVESDPKNADNLATLGEAAVSAGKFREGIDALQRARNADPAVQMPWFFSRVVHRYTEHGSTTFSVDFHPTKNVMVSAYEDKAIVLWDLNSTKILRTINAAHGNMVSDSVFSLDGSKIFSIGWDTALNVYDTESGQRTKQLTGHLNVEYRIERHPSRDVVVTASADGTARVWDMSKGQELVTLSGHSGAVMGAAFNSDGTRIATASRDGTLRIWETDGGKELAKIDAHSDGAWRVDWTPDDSRLVSCGRDKKVCVWDATTYDRAAVLDGHEEIIEVVRVSDDGRLAASGDIAGAIWIWDLEEARAIGVLREAGAVYNLQFRGNSLFSSGPTITKWDIDFSRSPLAERLTDVESLIAK